MRMILDDISMPASRGPANALREPDARDTGRGGTRAPGHARKRRRAAAPPARRGGPVRQAWPGWPSTWRQILSGLPSRSAAGSSACGRSW